MLCLDKRCVTQSVAVARSSCFGRLCVHTCVNQGHLLEDERECIRGVRSHKCLDERVDPHRRQVGQHLVPLREVLVPS
jgi:hypothetical protein